MKSHSKYFENIRIKQKPEGKNTQQVPECQWDNCKKPGSHCAPVGRMVEGRYFRFCLEHVRKYNRNFNYFSGLPDSEIARFQKEAVTGHRPTWKMGTEDSSATAATFAFRPRSVAHRHLRKGNPSEPSSLTHHKKLRSLRLSEKNALETLGLDENAPEKLIRNRYTELVKRHHPDANGGNRTSEEQFREVLQAYRILKKANLC